MLLGKNPLVAPSSFVRSLAQRKLLEFAKMLARICIDQ